MKHRSAAFILAGLLLLVLQAACATPSSAASPTDGAPAAASPFGNDADNPGFCAANLATPQNSGIIVGVTLARDVQGDNEPLDPTTQFGASDTLHAIVSIDNAPPGTHFTAAWTAMDVGDPSICNTQIAEDEIVAEGTRNLDFSLTPQTDWPLGSYKVEISINGALDQVVNYTIQ